MKPRVFIGSSTEALDIAYAIQENLEYDSNPTVWNQGIFKLSNNSLDDLIQALDDFDFGIFVFKPDDIIEIRNNRLNTIRDNIVFELGLFIGKLGKNKVFFVQPRSTNDFHLPTDLIGMTAGKYDDLREDRNLAAALGPFCNQVRQHLENFVLENLLDLKGESELVKRIAIERNSCWEFILSSELLKSRLTSINRSYLELEKGLVFQRSKSYDLEGFCQWFSDSTQDFIRIIEILELAFEIELIEAYGIPGIAGNVFEIKSAIDKIESLCKELLAWEYELQGINPPDEFIEAVQLMKGWTKPIISAVNEFPDKIDSSITPEIISNGGEINLEIFIPPPKNSKRILEIIEEVRLNI